jgi:Ca2+:H+ antiporter
MIAALRRDWALPLAWITTAVFFVHGADWIADPVTAGAVAAQFFVLFAVILAAAFALVRHAGHVADMLGEPLGTLVLTLAMTGLEVLMISAVSASDAATPTMARDSMFAAMMVLLNGMVGVALLTGGWYHREQGYNLQGARAFLAVILPMSLIGLVLPDLTRTTAAGTMSPVQMWFVVVASIVLYGIFLAIQNVRHREFFVDAEAGAGDDGGHGHSTDGRRSVAFHSTLMVAYALPMVLLAHDFADPMNHAIDALGAPTALGGLLIAILVLSPESLSATRAAAANQLQRAVNVLLGSVLATISLTIPSVLLIGWFTGRTVVLGLDPVDIFLLLGSLALANLTFSGNRTHVLHGAVHLLMFAAYLALLFER